MPKTKVGIARCSDYDQARVFAAIREACERAGGIEFNAGSNVLIKPNLLRVAPIERGVITHPEVLRATIRLVKELGAKPFVAELPGIGPASHTEESIAPAKEVCAQEQVEFRLFKQNGFRKIDIDGACLKELHLPNDIFEADYIINLPKLKTHMLTTITGAVKNLFGCLPFSERKQVHGLGAKKDFANTLLDILSAVKPDFAIIDGIDAMEGHGPSNGNIVRLGYIIAGKDSVAVDAVGCKLAGWNPQKIEHLALADPRGLGVSDLSQIEIVGDAKVKRPRLALPPTLTKNAPAWAHKLAYKLWSVKPKILVDKCTGCATCAAACPGGAITIIKEKACINYDNCIECFCCKELCPSDAVGEKLGLVTQVMQIFESLQKRGSL